MHCHHNLSSSDDLLLISIVLSSRLPVPNSFSGTNGPCSCDVRQQPRQFTAHAVCLRCCRAARCSSGPARQPVVHQRARCQNFFQRILPPHARLPRCLCMAEPCLILQGCPCVTSGWWRWWWRVVVVEAATMVQSIDHNLGVGPQPCSRCSSWHSQLHLKISYELVNGWSFCGVMRFHAFLCAQNLYFATHNPRAAHLTCLFFRLATQ